MRKVLILSLAIASAALAGCNGAKIPGVYRIDIRQGNIVTRAMLDRLKPGMDKRKVRFILGTPLLQDTFDPNRWDYVYEFQPGSGTPTEYHVSVFFKNGRLDHVAGDLKAKPGKSEASPAETVVTVPNTPSNEGFFSHLNPFSSSETQASTTATKPQTTPPETRSGTAEAKTGAKSQATGSGTASAAAGTAKGTSNAATTPPEGAGKKAASSTGNGKTGENIAATKPATGSGAEKTAAAKDKAASQDEGGFFSRLARRLGIGGDSSTQREDAQDGQIPQPPAQ